MWKNPQPQRGKEKNPPIPEWRKKEELKRGYPTGAIKPLEGVPKRFTP